MARVTVEDCTDIVPNRFELVMLASQRARDISSGARLTIERDNDKDPVIALREIADETVDTNVLKDIVVQGMQKHAKIERFDPELAGEEGDEAELSNEVLDELDDASKLASEAEDPNFSFAEDNLDVDD